MDRRVKRTKSAIFGAAIELMVEKDPKKITVLELCKRADINKSTFYLHYKSIDDCLQKCLNTVMNGIEKISRRFDYYEMKKDPSESIKKILDEVENNLDYFNHFKQSAFSKNAISAVKKNLVSGIVEHNNFNYDDNYKECLAITFMVSGAIDAILEPLPVFKKDELQQVLTGIIKH